MVQHLADNNSNDIYYTPQSVHHRLHHQFYLTPQQLWLAETRPRVRLLLD